MLKELKAIEHIGIYSSDPKKLTDWYCNTFGMEIVYKIDKGVPEKSIYFLKAGNGMIVEILPASSNQKVERNVGDPGFSHIGIVVKDMSNSVEILKSKGVIFKEIRETSMGWTIGYFNDIDGNTIELIHRPKNEKL